MCMCVCVCFFLKLQFQYCLWGQWFCFVYSIWWTLTMTWLCERSPKSSMFSTFAISLRSTAWSSSLFLLHTESKQIEMSLVLAPTICPPTFHTIKRLCMCVFVWDRVCVCVCVCLIKLCLATLIAAGASESITIPPSQTPLHLHSSCLVWRISQVGEYIFRVSLL